jgi:hypothetical protein
VHAANNGDTNSQAQLEILYFMFAMRLDILQGAPADDHMVEARLAEALHFLERAAGQADADAQVWCGMVYASGGRSVPQNWATAAKWWRKAADAGLRDAQWNIGVCYYYGRGVDRNVAQAKVCIRKSAAWFSLYDRRVSREKRVLLGKQLFVLRTLALLRTDRRSAPVRGKECSVCSCMPVRCYTLHTLV